MAGVVLVVGIALTCRRRGGSTPSTAPRGGMKGVTAQATAAQKGKQLPNAAKGAGAPAAAPLPIGKGASSAAPLPIGKGPATVAGALKGGAAAPFKAVIPPAPPGKAAAPAAAPPGKAANTLPGKAAAPAAAPPGKAAATTLQGVAPAATAATASKGAPPAAKPPPPRPGSGKK